MSHITAPCQTEEAGGDSDAEGISEVSAYV